MDQPSLRLLKMQGGCCSLCGQLLLHADHRPQSPLEWEQWVRVTGKVLNKHRIAYRGRGASGETTTVCL